MAKKLSEMNTAELEAMKKGLEVNLAAAAAQANDLSTQCTLAKNKGGSDAKDLCDAKDFAVKRMNDIRKLKETVEREQQRRSRGRGFGGASSAQKPADESPSSVSSEQASEGDSGAISNAKLAGAGVLLGLAAVAATRLL